MKGKVICSNCGAIDSKKETIEGGRSVILFLILFMFMVVPGLLYWGFKSKAKKVISCKECSAENTIINLGTPKGKKLYLEYHND